MIFCNLVIFISVLHIMSADQKSRLGLYAAVVAVVVDVAAAVVVVGINKANKWSRFINLHANFKNFHS